MNEITLSSGLHRFAEDCVRDGRYGSVTEVVEAGLRLLRRVEAERAAFVTSLEEAEAEGERDGFLSIEEVNADVMAAIDAAARASNSEAA